MNTSQFHHATTIVSDPRRTARESLYCATGVSIVIQELRNKKERRVVSLTLDAVEYSEMWRFSRPKFGLRQASKEFTLRPLLIVDWERRCIMNRQT